jgi:hypothetical protein
MSTEKLRMFSDHALNAARDLRDRILAALFPEVPAPCHP